MSNITKTQEPPDDNVVLFPALLWMEPQEEVPQLTRDELLLVRQMLQEFAIIRATCPLAVRALSTR